MVKPVESIDFKIQQVLPTVYDDSLSFYELVNKVVQKVNELIGQSNEYFGQDLEEYTAKILIDWKTDGTLSTIINNEVYNNKANQTDLVETNGRVTTLENGNFQTRVTALENEQKLVNTDKLRIAYHFNYETDESKMVRLRNLGFNAVWVGKQHDFMFDKVRTLAFLDRLKKYGIRAILQVNVNAITGQVGHDIEVERQWIRDVEGHEAVLGFTHYDEPNGQLISPSLQQLAYDNIKGCTLKNVYVVEAETDPKWLYQYYAPNSFDVYLLDIYATRLNQGLDLTEDDVKKEVVKRVFNIMSYSTAKQPKQIIPCLPLFSDQNFSLTDTQRLKWHLDAWRPFTNGSYMVFAHDVSHSPQALIDTLDTNETLRKMCLVIADYMESYPSFHVTRILPKGFSLHPMIQDYKDFDYDGDNFGKIGQVGTEGISHFTYRVLVNVGATKLVNHVMLRQNYDGDTRRIIKVEYTTNGYEWLPTTINNTFGAVNMGATYVSINSITADTTAIWVRVTLDNRPVGNGVIADKDFIGILSASSVTI